MAEVHFETPPFAEARGYVTASWTDESVKPTFISAVERPVLLVGHAFVGLGAGLLWVETNGYQPYPLLVEFDRRPTPDSANVVRAVYVVKLIWTNEFVA